jgi:hypothetical protein
MPRTKRAPEVREYYQAVQEIFAKQAEILTAVLPHFGERGRNDEERLRDLLSKVLPKKFSLGTGFIVCQDSSVPHSAQTDIVIYDEHQNSPLHRELSAYVYPIETVYATLEVKGRFQSKDLRPVLRDIAKIRRLSDHKWYVRFGGKPKDPSRPKKLVVAPEDVRFKLAPRTYLVAYDTATWTSADSLSTALRRALSENPRSHLHGVLVLNKGWFLYQEAYEEQPILRVYTNNALLRFIHKLTYDCLSVPMAPMSLDKYFGVSYGAG